MTEKYIITYNIHVQQIALRHTLSSFGLTRRPEKKQKKLQQHGPPCKSAGRTKRRKIK